MITAVSTRVITRLRSENRIILFSMAVRLMIVAVAFGHHARGFGQLDVGHAFGYNFLTGRKTGDDLAMFFKDAV